MAEASRYALAWGLGLLDDQILVTQGGSGYSTNNSPNPGRSSRIETRVDQALDGCGTSRYAFAWRLGLLDEQLAKSWSFVE
jgi:hypothetical protein